MTCDDSKRWWSLYVDDRLDPPSRSRLELHLSSCARCRDGLASLQGMLRILGAMEPPQAPELLPGIRERLAHEPWWQALATRCVAPWPESLPLHGLGLAMGALLVIVVSSSLSPMAGSRRATGVVGSRPLQLASTPARRDMAADEFLMKGVAEELESPRSDVERRGEVNLLVDTDAKLPETAKGDFDAAGAIANGVSDSFLDAALDRLEEGRVAEEEAPVEAMKMAAPPALEARWTVNDLSSAAKQIIQWVASQQGVAVAADERHLFITLPARAVPEFLRQFSDRRAATPMPFGPGWVTITLTLAPSE